MRKLHEYRRKRLFDRTPEPPPGARTIQKEDIFVVQEHAARRLHYDFRLAIGGVLKSWAVPKGPSLNPADKRLAIQTEDHPMEYADFEGTIPAGSYGAGTVMVWDRGTFRAEEDDDAARQLFRGELKFNLQGEKLRGGFVLVKLKRREQANQWLLIKRHDAAASVAWNPDEHDRSVLTGRTLEEIAAELPPDPNMSPVHPAELHGARRSTMPSRIDPMLAKLIAIPFSDPDWLFEIKWDGARAMAWIAGGRIRLRSRNGNDITQQYPELESLPEFLNAKRAILDGEIVVLDPRGHSDFGRVQERMHVRSPSAGLVSRVPMTYFVFDLLYCDGYDLREAPLVERKELLRQLLRPHPQVRFSDHQVMQGKELFDLACKEGLEGIIGKRADSKYVSARSENWVKLKATKTLDAVVAGWTAPRGARSHFGSLLLGLYEDGKLRFIGHVGTGFDEKTQRAIAKEIRRGEVAKCPFATPPKTNEMAFWTKPELVARVRFTGWTQGRRLREPVFMALREDAQPEDCRWEGEIPAELPAAAVRAPRIAGRVLTIKRQIEKELFGGTKEDVTIELEGKRLRLSNLNKVYFPESGYTKRSLLAYYYRIADHILPFLIDRPLVLRRYPDGIQGQAFFQKDVREGLPEWLETVSVSSGSNGKNIHYVMANDRPSLLFLTGLGCIDHNPWSSRRDDFEHPDYFFFDLDPAAGTAYSVVMTVARAIYEKLDALGLKVFLKTSGATGFHLYLPVEAGYTYEQLRAFAEIVARLVAAEVPNLVTQERMVAKRPAGRVLIDVQQNALGRPLAAPYSLRPLPKAPVSAPVLPRELQPNLHPEKFNLKTIFARLERKGDLWADFWNSRQRMEKAVKRLSKEMH